MHSPVGFEGTEQWPAFFIIGLDGWGLGLDGRRPRSEWLGSRPGRLENKSRMVGARPGWLGARPAWSENKS